MARAIMLQGTGSDVGKTVLVAGLCRVARRRGIAVRPFKPQNMSNNAAVADDAQGGGGEIGRGQWLQALAAGVPPSVHMNPVLLKPQSEIGAQVVVQGRMTGHARARDYQAMKDGLMQAVLDSWTQLGAGADLVQVADVGLDGVQRGAFTRAVLRPEPDRGHHLVGGVAHHQHVVRLGQMTVVVDPLRADGLVVKGQRGGGGHDIPRKRMISVRSASISASQPATSETGKSGRGSSKIPAPG